MDYLLEDKLESAAMVVAGPAIPWANLYTGKSAGDIKLPCAIFEAEVDGPEEPLNTGNFFCNLTVSLCQSTQDAEAEDLAADPGVGSAGAAGGVAKGVDQVVVSMAFSALMREELPALLTAAVTDLHVWDRSCVFTPARRFKSKGVWRDELRIRVYACGSALAP